MASTSNHIIAHHQYNNQHNTINVMNISCASPSNTNNGFEYSSSNNSNNNTTFVQADPSNFRSVVQKLTGHDSSSIEKSNAGPRRSTFKLHERRHSARKLENIKLLSTRQRISTSILVSPVSPLEMLPRGISPRSPMELEEDRAIAEKGFYLHPTTPRASQPPQLLPLFPLHSPIPAHHSSSS